MVAMGRGVRVWSLTTAVLLALSLVSLALVDADDGQPAARPRSARAVSAQPAGVASPEALPASSPTGARPAAAAAVSVTPPLAAPQPIGKGVAVASRTGPQSFNPCTDPDSAGLDVSCLPDGTVGQLLRQVCSYAWLAGLCEATAFEDPGYATSVDPHPGQPLALRVGAVHNHSGYSDGDPTAIPRDYFNAAKTGHNTADSGGDTGVKLDFMWGSDHSDNEQIPVTTAAVCVDPTGALACSHVTDTDHYWKWPAALRQAVESTDFSPTAGYNGFTGIRGFEWTNDYFNHMNAYFSTNFVNVKVDGSYVSMDFLWNWLRKPVSMGGGADALMTFNHPGGDPHLTPFDSGTPVNALLGQFPGGGNWNDVAYVPDVDSRVAAMEVNGGDDIEWYVKGLTNGWHIGAVANEDEHEREWASSAEGKTLILTRGRSPQDYYFALQNQRTIAIREPLVNGAPGHSAIVPTMYYFADGANVQDPAATLLGSTINTGGTHALHLQVSGLPANSKLALVSNTGGGQRAPIQLGAADGAGAAAVTHAVITPSNGEDWYFVVVCPAAATRCGSDQNYTAVTAPIWLTR
jgi:hypothetical protein